MSVQVLCPTCATVTELHRPPVTSCGRCQTEYPPNVRLAAETALVHAEAPKPALLAVGQWFALVAGAVFLLLLILAPFDLATYSINGDQVSGSEFLRRGGLAFGLLGGVQLGIGIGLLRERAWARPLMIYYWLAVLVTTVSLSPTEPTSIIANVLSCAVPAACAGWYLYVKPNVVAYFDARQPR